MGRTPIVVVVVEEPGLDVPLPRNLNRVSECQDMIRSDGALMFIFIENALILWTLQDIDWNKILTSTLHWVG